MKEEARYDGKRILMTNTADKVAVQYKQLWMVEQIFRTGKRILGISPIYHKGDEAIGLYVFCIVLAFCL